MTEDISVILPVYNGGSYLRESVESVMNQSHSNFEFIILDDCSTDGSWEYLKSLTNAKIKLFRNSENKGLFFNLNWLIKESCAPLIKLWAQDDIMYPDCLSGFVKFNQQHPQLGFTYSERDMIDENGNLKGNNVIDHTPEIISTELHARIAYFTGSIAGNIANVCIRRNALEKVGGFNEQMKISADFDMWVRLAQYYETGFIRQKLIKLRDHAGQLSRNEIYYLDHVKEDLEVYRYLDQYINADVRQKGRIIMRSHKLIFYYTLMIKALVNGKFRIASQFFNQLKNYDHILPISFEFLKSKFFQKKGNPYIET
jgi:glycosyltransferase involved in cell wall biosynthesis